MEYRIRTLCRALNVHPSGYYRWLRVPHCARALEDRERTRTIKELWRKSDQHSGYRNIHLDLRDANVDCGRDRVLRLIRQAGIQAERGYVKSKGTYSGKPHWVIANTLNRAFDVAHPNQWWVSDITYIKTHEGFLFLAVVMDLYARNIVGWSMGSRITDDLVLNALTMAYRRRRPAHKVMLHSDQGSQYTSQDCQSLLKTFNIEPSMSRRGNCLDNAIAESFFANLKKEKVRGKQYKTLHSHHK